MTYRPYGWSEHAKADWLDESARIAEEEGLCPRHLLELPCSECKR